MPIPKEEDDALFWLIVRLGKKLEKEIIAKVFIEMQYKRGRLFFFFP